MKSLDPHAFLAPCFPSIVTAGITYKSFFPSTYSKPTGTVFKTQLTHVLQMHYGMNVQLLTQVHGVRVLPHIATIEGQNTRSADAALHLENASTLYPEADGHYTLQTDACLGVLVADCAGVLLHDVSTNYNAALHSGWKGTSHNIVGACIQDAEKKRIAHPSSLIAWISPCARMCCYEVGSAVAEYFISIYPEACRYDVKTKKHSLDIARIIEMQLKISGLMPHNIHTAPVCTICSERFHSHRRDGPYSGRCLVFIGGTVQE